MKRISKRDILPLEVRYNLQQLYDKTDKTYKFRDNAGNAIMTIDPNTGIISFGVDLILDNNVTITGTFVASGTNTFAGTNTFSSVLKHHVLEETGYGSEQTTGGTPSASTASGSPEDAAAAFDDNFSSKWVAVGDSTPWLKYQFASAKTITKYVLTTGNDAPDRHPKTWTFEGSNNDSDWTVIETRTNAALTTIGVKHTFYVPGNTTAYIYYRINISVNNGSADSQLAEFQMYEDA